MVFGLLKLLGFLNVLLYLFVLVIIILELLGKDYKINDDIDKLTSMLSKLLSKIGIRVPKKYKIFLLFILPILINIFLWILMKIYINIFYKQYMSPYDV